MVNGMASVNIGCRQCHGSKIALESVDGGLISVDELKPTTFAGPISAADAAGTPIEAISTAPAIAKPSWVFFFMSDLSS